ncbi:MAG: chitobiase/beta-hexosaminidase C-terminal domain-containing protein [Verrucomicrobiales bacterium]
MTDLIFVRNRRYLSLWIIALTLLFQGITFGSTAALVAVDKNTQGSWKGVYGNDGYLIPYQGGTAPSYVSVAFSGSSQWVWNYNTTSPAAVQKPTGTDRIASCWYAPSEYSVQLNFTDDLTHRVAYYFLDWDNLGRRQTVTVTDSANGSVLNEETLSGFAQGVWLVWDVKGSIKITTKALSGNAVAGGLFFGGNSVAPNPAPSQVATPVFSPAGGSFSSATTATITSSTVGATIRYTTDGSSNPTETSAVYSGPLAIANSVTIKAKAFAPGMTESAVATASFVVNTPTPPVNEASGNSAAFLAIDTTTQGDWNGVYGGDGNRIAAQGGTLPSYVTTTFSGSSEWVWNYNSTDKAALQKNNSTDRVASCWYAASSHTVNFQINDGLSHRLAIYCLDWDGAGRKQTLTLTDSDTGAVLNSQTISSFSEGVWVVWNIKGKVTLTVKSITGNAVVNGIFFGPGGSAPSTIARVATPVITPSGGSFSGQVTVTMSSGTAGATIRYTADGSTPTLSSAVYNSALIPSTSVTYKARAFKSGMTDSAVATATFNINNPTGTTGPLADLANNPNTVFPAPEGFDTIQYAPDGKLGFIVWKDRQLIYRERNTSGNWSESVVNGGGNVFQMLLTFSYGGMREDYRFQPSAILLFDVQSQPHVLQANGRNVAHYTRSGGNWGLFETISNPAASDNISVLVGSMGPNNIIHLGALTGGSPRKLTYGSNKAGQWIWSHISNVTDAPLSYWAPPYAPRWLSLAADSRNNAHMTFRTSMDMTYDSAGHPRAYSELKYASNASGQWSTALVQKPDDVSAEAANGASIAIAPDDKPRIASWYNDRGDGGSASESRLFYHEPTSSGTWNRTMVLRNPDGYSAGDGPKGAGFSPHLKFDQSGRPHILFLDHAGEHFGGIGQQEYAGNLRHAWRNGSTWSFETIYRQTSPVDREIIYPTFAMSGNEMAVTLLQRETKWNFSSFPPLSNSTYYFRFFTKQMP